jgi:hypothetical protein
MRNPVLLLPSKREEKGFDARMKNEPGLAGNDKKFWLAGHIITVNGEYYFSLQ